MDIREVVISKQAEKQLRKMPASIILKLQLWVDGIKNEGLMKMRRIPGFHDEPLKGKRQGQRSVRLNKAYRAIYVVDESGATHIINVIEVHKHAY